MRIMHITRATLMVRQFLLPLIRVQRNRGHYVCVCGAEERCVPELRDEGIDVFTHQLKRTLNPYSILKAVFVIRRHIKNARIDVVICHTPLGAGVGRIAARMAGVRPIIYFAHGLPFVSGQNKIVWLFWLSIEKILGRITDAAILMNTYDENACKEYRLVKDVKNAFRVPGMGVDLQKC